jgi:hypothetical protein
MVYFQTSPILEFEYKGIIGHSHAPYGVFKADIARVLHDGEPHKNWLHHNTALNGHSMPAADISINGRGCCYVG